MVTEPRTLPVFLALALFKEVLSSPFVMFLVRDVSIAFSRFVRSFAGDDPMHTAETNVYGSAFCVDYNILPQKMRYPRFR